MAVVVRLVLVLVVLAVLAVQVQTYLDKVAGVVAALIWARVLVVLEVLEV
jgi:hypothetical protein